MEQHNYDNSFELRSEEVQDILAKVPHWMIRWGTAVIFAIILMMFVVSWFLKYPDIVKSDIILTTTIPPEKLVAKASGRIQAILVKNNEDVGANKPLAIIENSSNYLDIFKLKAELEKYQKKGSNQFPFDQFKAAQFGEIESYFSTFQKDYIANKLNADYHPFQVENVAQTSESIQIKERLALLSQQKELNQQELLLQQSELARHAKLHEKGVISSQEFEVKKMAYLQAEKNYKNLLSSISQLKSSLIQNSKSIKGNTINEVKEEVNLDRSLSQSFYQLKKAIKEWELNYVLQSQIEGKISFTKYWIANQTVTSGEEVFSVVPIDNKSFVGKVKAPAANSGKIKVGQKVNIRLFNFPDREFGLLNGEVQNISLVPDKDGNLLIDVVLTQGLETSYKKSIPFQQEMRGSAEIVTEDLRLIERIFYQFREMAKVD